jgi:3-oxoacid CoA-transferase B subunit
MATPDGWSMEEVARRIADDLRPQEVVNLGIGLPTLVARYTDPARGIIFHSENGIVGMGPEPPAGAIEPDVIDAGKSPVTLVPGAAIIDHVESFGIIRGGYLDCAVLGAFQVSVEGDLANWRLAGSPIGSVGGAMDIAVGARRVVAMMRHVDKAGGPKIVERCSMPLTARRCVTTIATDLAIIDVTPQGLVVRESAVDRSTLETATGAPLRWGEGTPPVPGQAPG